MADRLKELLQAHYTDRGLKPPAKESRFSFMFYGFVGGVNTALALINTIEDE